MSKRRLCIIQWALVAVVLGLVMAGFVSAAVLDGTNVPTSPVTDAIARLPMGVRIALVLIVGAPLAIGACLYVIVEVLDLLGFVTSPIAWIARSYGRGTQGRYRWPTDRAAAGGLDHTQTNLSGRAEKRNS